MKVCACTGSGDQAEKIEFLELSGCGTQKNKIQSHRAGRNASISRATLRLPTLWQAANRKPQTANRKPQTAKHIAPFSATNQQVGFFFFDLQSRTKKSRFTIMPAPNWTKGYRAYNVESTGAA